MSVQVKVRGSTDLLIIYHLSDALCFSHYSKENECPQQNITIISITRKKNTSIISPFKLSVALHWLLSIEIKFGLNYIFQEMRQEISKPWVVLTPCLCSM